MLKRSVESSAVHWLKTKEECRLDENEGFVSSGGNLLRNVRQAGHMANKEGLLVHVRTCKDTQPKRVPNSAGYMVSDLLGICIGPCMFVQLRKQHSLWRVHTL